MRRILVIKLGALGDFVLSTSAFAAIREKEHDAHITLLTTPGMRALADPAPYFDAVSYDERKKFWNLIYGLRLKRKLQGYDMVYDLQTSNRSQVYYHLAGAPDWCGIAAGCSHRQINPERNKMHTLDRLKDQLALANVRMTKDPDVRYAAASADDILKKFLLKSKNFVVLVPGGSAHRPEKRWPHFAKLANELMTAGHQVALVGGPDEKELLGHLAHITGAVNLSGQTKIPQLIDVLSKAKAVVGNDTGPMHIAAACGVKNIVLFGPASNPDLCAPRGKLTQIIKNSDIAAISAQQVLDSLKLK